MGSVAEPRFFQDFTELTGANLGECSNLGDLWMFVWAFFTTWLTNIGPCMGIELMDAIFERISFEPYPSFWEMIWKFRGENWRNDLPKLRT